jgi:hypothetical protein
MDEATMRAALRLTADFVLRNVEVATEATGGDLMLGLIFATILQANVNHIREDPALAKRIGLVSAIVPDDIRRPISINALAESLGIPYETTRRYVNRLLALDLCVKVGARGVVIPASAITTPEAQTAAVKQFGHLLHFLRQLREIGFEFP